MCYFKYFADGLENIQQKKIFKENKEKTQQSEEPCAADSVDSLMAEMPFVDTDIEDEHCSKYIKQKKCESIDTSCTQFLVLPVGKDTWARHMEQSPWKQVTV